MGFELTKIEGFQQTNYSGTPPYPPHYHIFGGTRGIFSKVVLGFLNFGYDI